MCKKSNVFSIGLLVVLLTVAADAQEEGFSKEVEDILDKRIAAVRQELAQNPLIIKATRESSEKNKNLTLSEITELDKKWRSAEGITDFMKGFLTNECAERLIAFQDDHDGYPEIFIADAKGLNVCQTNKTSDYYQADEDWWIKGFNEGKGRTFHGEIEYDESAMAEAIPVFIPIIDPDIKNAIGVMKIIIDITSIKMEL